MIASVPVLLLVSWALYVRLPNFVDSVHAAATAFGEFRARAGVAFPLTAAIAMMVGGLPLFARGLTEYEFSGGKKDGLSSWWQRRVQQRRV
jgi:hypothetical protein